MQSAVYYDSWSFCCKLPFGAVREEEELRLRLTVDSSLQSTGASLVLRQDKAELGKSYPLFQKAADNHSITYELTVSVEKAGLYFYRFEIQTDRGILFVGKADESRAAIGDFLPEWQLTVYGKAFTTPDWIAQGVMYQIFPDRFRKGSQPSHPAKNERTCHTDWYERPLFTQDDPDYEATDFFGGNLSGIIEKLPYLQELGVNVLYLNPIFEAAANHRYNTGNYLAVDPYLGNEEEFRRLCAEAKQRGIAVILDGVFSHTGSDSIYFNKEGHYNSLGAFQSSESPYRSWYQFSEDQSRYECWWGFPTLPNVNETDPQYLSFICGENGVLAHWQESGAAGWRLDVADELPDDFLQALRRRVKAENPSAYIVGEVWEDASNKESYGCRRPYLLGEQLDSVMNYPWRSAILNFIKSGNANAFYQSVMELLDHYPQPAIHTLMNLLSTHDTIRVITDLGVAEEVPAHQQGDYQLTPQQYETGRHLFQLAALLQYTLPGFPSLYYGDEAGLTGFADPWNRRCYPWDREDLTLIEFFRQLGKIRQTYAKNFQGAFRFIAVSDELVAFVREEQILTVVNRSPHPAYLAVQGQSILACVGQCTLEMQRIRIEPDSGAIITIA